MIKKSSYLNNYRFYPLMEYYFQMFNEVCLFTNFGIFSFFSSPFHMIVYIAKVRTAVSLIN